MKHFKSWIIAVLFITIAISADAQRKEDISDAKEQLKKILRSEAKTGINLVKFDTLDFVVYSTQNWKRLHESHARKIRVVYPDGSITIGLEDHIKQLMPMFTFAPDTKIIEHPIRFGSNGYTAVTGYTIGTFTKPMKLPDGTSIAPTGKKFKLPMCTIGIWKDGLMIEEQLFWDNRSLMEQIGL